MPSTDLRVLLIFVVTFQALVAEAQLDGTCTATAGTCTGEPNADACNSESTPGCLCNINYVVAGTDCALIACTDGTSVPTTVCNGANTACTKDTNKCSCIANFETVATTPTLCTQITCTTEMASLCTDADANSYCLTTDCVCKKNFIGTNLANCEKQSCANDAACSESNSACHTGANAGCGCDTLFTADATNGACLTPKNCTAYTTVTATCGTNTVCELSPNVYLCLCQANYQPSATGCVLRTCSGTATTCDPDSQCLSSQCQCAASFTASGSICKKDCSNDASACHATLATCANGVCECNVNYEGNGVTCTARTCTANVVTNCHPNSKCNTSGSTPVCACADGWVACSMTCKKSCTTANAETMCDANASCFSEKCECNVNYDGDGSTCTQKICNGTETINCDADSQCSSDNCVCADNFVVNGQACECTSTGFSLVGGLCKKNCTENSTENSQCGTNGACFNGSCECEPNYVGNAAIACTQIACNGTDVTNCAAKSSCESDKCVCTNGTFVVGSDQLTCAGREGIFCNFSLLMGSLLMFFFASKTFE